MFVYDLRKAGGHGKRLKMTTDYLQERCQQIQFSTQKHRNLEQLGCRSGPCKDRIVRESKSKARQ